MSTLETDYLVIGAGTSGLAFSDALVAESDARVLLVDRRGQPGGHWTEAYPFVRLHQPSAFYGVNSLDLGRSRKDDSGLNAGLYELASGSEVCSYFDRVMRERLLPSGRLDWRPMTEVLPDGRLRNLLSGEITELVVRRRVVDAAYGAPRIAANHRPPFEIAPGVQCVPPNALPGLATAPRGPAEAASNLLPRRFVILGAGKTAMDTGVWLLQSGARPEDIQWVMPRDSWLIHRLTTQPGMEFFEHSIGSQADQMQAFAEASTVDDLFLRLEAAGCVMRIHRDRLPTMFHLATISPGEVDELRRIEQVIRLGRVRRIEPHQMVLEHGEVPVAEGTLFIDCTASAVEPRPAQPIFQDGRIVIQLVRLPQPAFSAALIGWVEAHHSDDTVKNGLCRTVPFPYSMADYPATMLVNLSNQAAWGRDPGLRAWMRASRLDGFGPMLSQVDPQDAGKLAILARLKALAAPAMQNLARLAATARSPASTPAGGTRP